MEEGRERAMVRGTVQTLLQADGTTDGSAAPSAAAELVQWPKMDFEAHPCS